MNHDSYDPGLIRDILTNTRRIAIVGASPNAARPSNGVMRFLLDKGYDVVPINPGHAGKQIHGQTVVASLADIEGPVDMIDVFRAADQLSATIDEVLAMPNRPKVIWGQLTVRDDDAARKAEQAGITVIMNRCPAIEYPKVIG
ncbi:CoA-binding protein [Rhizobium sp.]